MNEPPRRKRPDGGLLTVFAALSLALCWAGYGVFYGHTERRSLPGFIPFFIAFAVLMACVWVFNRKR